MSSAAPIGLVTVGVIARRRMPALEYLVARMLEIEGPEREIVVGVETPGVDVPVEHVDERGVRWLELPEHQGIGYNRNRVLDAARGSVLFGIDDDCDPCDGWMTELLDALADGDCAAAVGSIQIPPAGFVGDAISALGFPAGGGAGYEQMFRVDPTGYTDNLAAGNCVVDLAVLREIGGFDESMTFGGEDTELAHRLTSTGHKIRYVPAARIVHPARTSIREFCRWLFVRGRAKRQFSRKVAIGGYVTHRLGSYGKIVRSHVADSKIVLIVPLLIASLLLQQAGFLWETASPRRAPVR